MRSALFSLPHFWCIFLLTSTGPMPEIGVAVGTSPPSLVPVFVRSSPLWHSHNLMATNLAPVDSREVVRCDHCLLVQFRTTNNNCRRCHASMDEEPEPEPIMVEAPAVRAGGGDG